MNRKFETPRPSIRRAELHDNATISKEQVSRCISTGLATAMDHSLDKPAPGSAHQVDLIRGHADRATEKEYPRPPVFHARPQCM